MTAGIRRPRPVLAQHGCAFAQAGQFLDDADRSDIQGDAFSE